MGRGFCGECSPLAGDKVLRMPYFHVGEFQVLAGHDLYEEGKFNLAVTVWPPLVGKGGGHRTKCTGTLQAQGRGWSGPHSYSFCGLAPLSSKVPWPQTVLMLSDGLTVCMSLPG